MVLRHSGRVDNCRFKEKPSNILKNMFEGFLICDRQDILFLIAVVFLLSLRADSLITIHYLFVFPLDSAQGIAFQLSNFPTL